MNEVVLFDVQDDVAVLTFNRPDRLNAWIPELQTRYFDLLDECAERDDVRAIVLTGAGRGFCAGADMQGLQNLSEGEANGQDGSAAHDPRPVEAEPGPGGARGDDALQDRRDGLNALRGDRRFIHAGRVKIADFLLHRRSRRARHRGLL